MHLSCFSLLWHLFIYLLPVYHSASLALFKYHLCISMLHRCFYTAAFAAICIISMISGAVAQCQVRPRREIRKFSPQERESYFNAIRQL